MTLALRRVAGTLLAAALAVTGAVAVNPAPAHASTATEDTIYYWNDVLLEAFRREGGAPGPLARAAAMMHAGIFDVLNSTAWARQGDVGVGYHGYTGIHPGDPPADDDLEAGRAARTLLIDALPGQEAFIQQAYADRHGGIGTVLHPITKQVIDAMRDLRENDGADDTTPYQFDGVPGAWQLTGHLCGSASDTVTPNWGRVTPFAMTSSTQFRQDPPGGFDTYQELLESSFYTMSFNEVQLFGRSSPSLRSADQTEIAWFWANDLDGTYKPVGQLLSSVQDVAEGENINDPVELSRNYALVSLALADAGVAAWDQKFETDIDLWRPQTAIQQAGADGNPDTNPVLGWEPLSADESEVSFNPCFPAWVSGHATFAAAWAGIMRNQFGDTVPITVRTEDPHAIGAIRTFTGFTAAAMENAVSRIYLGVHYRFDADSGLATGFGLADFVHANFLTFRCTDPNLC